MAKTNFKNSLTHFCVFQCIWRTWITSRQRAPTTLTCRHNAPRKKAFCGGGMWRDGCSCLGRLLRSGCWHSAWNTAGMHGQMGQKSKITPFECADAEKCQFGTFGTQKRHFLMSKGKNHSLCRKKQK